MRRSLHQNGSLLGGPGGFAVGSPDQIYVAVSTLNEDYGCGARPSGTSLVRFDAQGNCVFLQRLRRRDGQASHSSGASGADPTGDLVAEVSFTAGVDVGDGPEAADDVAILKLDPNGQKLWVRRLHAHGTHAGVLGRIAVSTNGEIGFGITA